MKGTKRTLLTLILLLSLYRAGAQDDSDLYRQTISFLKLLTYGERHEDIGLRFSWQQIDGRWVPRGNGFEFLSEGLGVYDYETEPQFRLPDYGRWYDDDTAQRCNDIDSLPGYCDEMVRFVGAGDSTCETVATAYVELLPMHEGNDSIIPAKIIRNLDEETPDRLGFFAMIDSKDRSLVIRFTNLLPYSVRAYIDNALYPASSHGLCSQSLFTTDEKRLSPTVSTIDMKGCVTLPPFSLTLFKFATRHGKTLH